MPALSPPGAFDMSCGPRPPIAGIAGTDDVLGFLAHEISRDTYLNLMDQYRPCYRAGEYPPLDRCVKPQEMENALRLADRHGLRRLDNATAWPRG